MKRVICLFLTACLIIMLSGCFNSQKESVTLYVPIDSEPVSLDPQIACGYGEEVIVYNCFEGLLRIDKDGTIDFGVAAAYDVSSDGLTYTFTLNPEACWHLTAEHKNTLGDDGYDSFNTAVTANDFVFALRRAVDPETNAAYASKLFCIKNAEKINNGSLDSDELGVEAVDDHTLQITLAYKDSSFLYTLASPVAMPCNEEFFNKTGGKYGLELDYILCNGPLYVTSWTHGSSVFIKKNADYNGKAQVKASLIGLMVNKDNDNRLSLLCSGTYDCDFVDAKAVGNLSDTSSLNLEKLYDRVWGLAVNTDTGALKNADIRKALFYAFDTSLFEELSYAGDKTESIVPSGCYLGNTPYSSLCGENVTLSYSESEALSCWKKGIKALDTETVSVTVTCSADFRSSIEKVVQKWQEVFGIGLSVKISEVSDIELLNAFGRGNYEVAFVPVSSDSSRADDYIEYICENSLEFDSSKLDSLVSDMKKQTDAEKKADDILKIEKLICSEGVFYPVFDGYTYFAVYDKADGFYYYLSKNYLSLYSGARYEE